MNDLLLSETTEKKLTHLIKHPPHAVGVVGAGGFGKTALSRYVIAEILKINREKLINYPYFLNLKPENKTISIEVVRQIAHFLDLKVPGKDSIRRAVLIEQAKYLTIPAQNALLKILEEPPQDTIIVLTLDDEKAVLPTITSRLQYYKLAPPSTAQATDYFVSKGYPRTKVDEALALSANLPGLTLALLNNEHEHPLIGAVAEAKKLLAQPTFIRLSMVDSLSKQKEEAMLLCQALQRIAEVGLQKSAAQSDNTSIKRWRKVLEASLRAVEALKANAQAKLTLSDLVLSLI